MLILTPTQVSELNLIVGYQLTCTSCTNTLFVESGKSITDTLTGRGWQQALTEHEHLPCVCPKCVAELKSNEQEHGENT